VARRDQQGGNEGRFLPILVFAVGLLLTVAAWHMARTHEESQERWTTDLAAQAIRTHLVTDVEWQVVGLDRLAMLWEAADPARELWTRNAELYIEHRPGCVAVEWVTTSIEGRALVTAEGKPRPLAFGGLPRSLLASVSRAKIALISAPEQAPDGSRQWAVAYPVYARGQLRGFIVSFFDLEKSLDHLLGNARNPDFSVGVSLPNQPEYVLPGTSRRYEQDWAAVVDIPLSGTTWQLRVWPNASAISELDSMLDELTLGVGSVLSVLLALTLYFGGRAALSSARTGQANEALQREMSIREGAQEELRRAHAELEMRVEQRTAELAGSNALLQKEVGERQRAEELLQEFTGRLFHMQDEERRRLARELHDGAVQNLVALAMDIGMVRDAIPARDVSAKELVDECVRLIEQSTNELRTISYLLHPPYFDELGLPAVLRDFVEGFATRSGIRVTLEIDPELGRLGHDLELTIFRVVQEALSNVHRHAQSPTAHIAIVRHAGFVRLLVADAGRGIPLEILAPGRVRLAGVGIAGMRERVRLLGGQLEIQSGATGTTICAVLPLPSSDMSARKAGASTAGTAAGNASPSAA
jgi:signal transduction histidine kinase